VFQGVCWIPPIAAPDIHNDAAVAAIAMMVASKTIHVVQRWCADFILRDSSEWDAFQ
jgi:hypothetical protein